MSLIDNELVYPSRDGNVVQLLEKIMGLEREMTGTFKNNTD